MLPSTCIGEQEADFITFCYYLFLKSLQQMLPFHEADTCLVGLSSQCILNLLKCSLSVLNLASL